MRINTNFASSAGLSPYLQSYNQEIEKSLGKITSGLRVNSPSEDNASYFKAQNLQRRADESSAVQRLIQGHVSRLQTAESGLKEARDMMDSLAELALKASNETNDTVRGAIGEEYDEKFSALEEFIASVSYEGEALLTGTYDSNDGGTAFSAQIDEVPSSTKYSYDILQTKLDDSNGMDLGSFKTANTDWGQAGGAASATAYHTALTNDDKGLTRMDRNLSRIGTHLEVLNGASNTLSVKSANYKAAAGSLVDVNDIEETARLSNLQIRRQVAMSFLAQNNVQQSQVIGVLTGLR